MDILIPLLLGASVGAILSLYIAYFIFLKKDCKCSKCQCKDCKCK